MEFAGQSPILKRIVGLAIEEVFRDREMLGLTFGMGWRLSIYNRFEYCVDNNRRSAEEVRRLVGAVVLSVHEDEKSVSLHLTASRTVLIDLSDEAFFGPEAMQLKGPSGEIVIWN